MADQAQLLFDGIATTAGWSFTFGVGIDPSQAVITMPAGVSIPKPVASMVLQYGVTSLVFSHCRVAQIVRAGRSTIRVTIQDRRWKWQFGKVDGNYNAKKQVSGTEVITREKTPQELATILLKAMGESGFSVTGISNLSRPTVTWAAANPAQELQSLATSLGCVVVLNPMVDKVQVIPIGTGGGLPTSTKRIQASSPISLQAQPDEWRVIGGPALFQATFNLGEAVGIDTDGEIKAVDSLTYKPDTGWEEENPYKIRNVKGEKTYTHEGKTLNTIDLANSTVWRMYRITGLKSGGWNPAALAGSGLEATGIEDLHIQTFQLRKAKGPDGEERRLPAEVRGVYESKELNYKNTKDGTKVKINFSIDAESGVVTFNGPVFQSTVDAKNGPAELTLEAAFHVGHDGVMVRHEEHKTATGTTYNAGPLLLHHPEIVREVIEGEGASDNLSDVEKESAHYMDASAVMFRARSNLDASYAGIFTGTVDGVNRQITWSGGGGRPGTTQISQNGEHNPYLPSYQTLIKANERDRAAKGFTMTDPEAKR